MLYMEMVPKAGRPKERQRERKIQRFASTWFFTFSGVFLFSAFFRFRKRERIRSCSHGFCEYQCATLRCRDRSQSRGRKNFQRTNACSFAKSPECQHAAACSKGVEHKSCFSPRAQCSWWRGFSPQEGPSLSCSQGWANHSADSSCDVTACSTSEQHPAEKFTVRF